MLGAAGAGRRTVQGCTLEYISMPYLVFIHFVKKPISSIGFFMSTIYYNSSIKDVCEVKNEQRSD